MGNLILYVTFIAAISNLISSFVAPSLTLKCLFMALALLFVVTGYLYEILREVRK